jgi:hypothetical protein
MCNGQTAGYSGGACTGCVAQGSSESEEGGAMRMGVLAVPNRCQERTFNTE